MVFYMQKQWGNLWITFFSSVLMHKVYGPWCFVCSASCGGGLAGVLEGVLGGHNSVEVQIYGVLSHYVLCRLFGEQI